MRATLKLFILLALPATIFGQTIEFELVAQFPSTVMTKYDDPIGYDVRAFSETSGWVALWNPQEPLLENRSTILWHPQFGVFDLPFIFPIYNLRDDGQFVYFSGFTKQGQSEVTSTGIWRFDPLDGSSTLIVDTTPDVVLWFDPQTLAYWNLDTRLFVGIANPPVSPGQVVRSAAGTINALWSRGIDSADLTNRSRWFYDGISWTEVLFSESELGFPNYELGGPEFTGVALDGTGTFNRADVPGQTSSIRFWIGKRDGSITSLPGPSLFWTDVTSTNISIARELFFIPITVGFTPVWVDGIQINIPIDDLSHIRDDLLAVGMSGLYQLTIVPEIEFIRGDADQDGVVTVQDMGIILRHIQGIEVVICIDACDANDDGEVNSLDIITMAQEITTGDPLPAPFPNCGLDPTPDILGCDSHASCQ